METITVIIIGSVALAIMLPLVALWIAYRRNPVVATIRQASKNLKKVKGYASQAQAALEDAIFDLKKQAREFVQAQRNTRLMEIPLERLKDAGAANVRWSALRHAGLTTLAQVLRLNERRLMSIQGVGRTTAVRVMHAARTLAARVLAEPPSLPSAALEEPYAERLVAGTMHLLHARDLLEGVPEQLNADVGNFRERFREILKRGNFGNWVFSKGAFAEDAQINEEVQVLLGETQELLEGEAISSTRNKLTFLSEETGRPFSKDRLKEEFRDRYAESVALIENFIFGRDQSIAQTLRKRTLGGLPTEVAERAEKIVLQTQGIRVTLRQYQVFGAKYLIAQKRTILGDEMGLGKTIEALAVMLHLNTATNKYNHFVVVAPASLTRNWMREIEDRTNLGAFLIHGPDRRTELRRWLENGGVAVTSYTTLQFHPKLLTSVPIRFLVVDEAHYVKNPQAQRTTQVKKLLGCSEYVCLMSGTPLENRPKEFVNIIEMVQPELAIRLQDGRQSDEVIGAARFREYVAHAYLRRNQKDVLRELPEKINVPAWVDMRDEDKAAYRTAVLERDFNRMRRIAILGCGRGHSTKMERLRETIDEHVSEGRKVLVFSFFLDVIDSVQEAIDCMGILKGSVPMKQRMDIIDRFQKSRGHGVLACQINVGGLGLNLHAASAVILMEPQWKPSTEEQAIARAHRMGQTRSVLVHRLLTRQSVEERMLEILAQKTQFFDDYVRDSTVKNASAEATETRLMNAVIDAEIARLKEKQTA